jgi:TRAP-type C4-dicarboxylate transport system permease small subunit
MDKVLEYLEITAEAAGFGSPESLPEIIGAVIAAVLSLLGIIFLCLIIYGGFVWMVSGGNETKVRKAKLILSRAVVGVIIVLASYAVTVFVLSALEAALT